MICSVDSFNSRYWKDIVSSAKNEPKGVKVDTMCIAYRCNANTNEVMGMKHETKGNHSRPGGSLLNVTYYKLWAGKHFAYYVIGHSIESYRIGSAREFLSQTLMIPRGHCIRETMRKKLKIVAKACLCGGQCRGSTMTDAMKSNLSDAIRDVIQINYWDGTSGIDKSCRVLHS